jgi:hypothetical protein
VPLVEEKLVQHRLKLFGNIQWMPPEELVHNGVINRSGNGKRGKRRTNLTWEEYVERYLKDWSITKELVLDRSEWKLTIHVS